MRTRDARLDRVRKRTAREWQELMEAIRSESGLATRGVTWAAALGGLALGLELARRWFRAPEKTGDR